MYLPRFKQLLKLLWYVWRPVGYVEIPDAQHQHHVHRDTGRMPWCLLCDVVLATKVLFDCLLDASFNSNRNVIWARDA
jgi:hypothetical protein